mmetsp:Transcript_67986/g.148088  ORF Transcript_67986/g.148088 Transcript_67986/m.148088 type:complete len:264 (+) Transcript_67986:144-935(+)
MDVPELLSSEALRKLDLLELLLLQHEGQLRNEEAGGKCAPRIHAVDVLQHNVLLLLAKAAHVGVCGDRLVLLHGVTNVHDNGCSGEHLLRDGASVSPLDCDSLGGIALNGHDLALQLCVELVHVALVALGIDLATATVAAKVHGELVKVDVLVGGGIRSKDWEDHLLVPGAGNGASHHDVRLLLAVLHPREALHLLLGRLGEAVLGSKLEAIREDSNGSDVHVALLAGGQELLARLPLGWNLNHDLEDGVREHSVGQTDVDRP